MANPAEAIETIIVAKRTTLEQRLATAIQEKMKRNDDASQDFDALPLWLTIEINNTTNAKVGFHAGNYDAGPPSSELIDVDLRILEQLAEATIEPAMANRVCDAVLSFRTGRPAEEDPNLLSSICSNIRPNALKLQLTGEDFKAGSVRSIVKDLGAGHLRELETLAICGPDIVEIGGNDTIRKAYDAIIDEHELGCPKLQTLILDFNYPFEDRKYGLNQLLTHRGAYDDCNLSEAPLTIVVPKAELTFNGPNDDENFEDWIQVEGAIRRLSKAICHGGLQCMKLQFRVDVTRSQLDNFLQGLRRRPPTTMMKNLKIQKPVPDSNAAVDAEGNVETIRHVVWQNTENSRQQRMELTHRGPKDLEGEEEVDTD